MPFTELCLRNKKNGGHKYGNSYPKQFRELDAETDGTARPSGRTAALLAAVRQSPEPDRTYQDVRQPRPLYAAPNQQAYPATLPQYRRVTVQDARQKDLLQRRGRADVPFRTRKGLQKRRYSLLQGSYP